MATMIFVNLPVKDLERATSFYLSLGFEKNPQFSDENASCIVISETIFAMLLVEPYFSTFTKKPLVDAKAQTEVLLALSEESRDGVDARIAKALANGGAEAREVQDLGFMYSRAFEDPDGHIWELMWMDPAAVDG